MKETSMETPSYDIETEKMMVCYERDSFFKRDFTDHRTDHRFFCGQFFIWDTECQTVRKDHTGHESGHEPPSGSRYLGGQYNRRIFSQDFCLTAGAAVLLAMGGYRMFRFFFPGKSQKEQKVRELDYFQGILLAVLLSLDGVAAGIGTGLVQARTGFLIPGVFLGGMVMMEAGLEGGKPFSGFFSEGYFLDQRSLSDGPGSGNLCKL